MPQRVVWGGRALGVGWLLAAVMSSVVLCESLAGQATAGPEKPAVARARKLSRRGEALFRGTQPLVGRIRDHRSPLPPEAIRCVNCHGAAAEGPGNTKPLAPALDRALLTEERVRRTGPPAAYDHASFCKLLRTGVDPVHVVVAVEMPTYDIDDSACAALWSYLTDETSTPQKKADQQRPQGN